MSEEPKKEVASVAIFNSEGKLLFLQRADTGKWTLPGGHLEPGERPERAAIRELLEETGLRPETHTMELLGDDVVTGWKGNRLRIHAFKCHLPPGHDVSYEGDPDAEAQDHEWVDPAYIPTYILENLHAPKNVTLRLLGLHSWELSKAEDLDKMALKDVKVGSSLPSEEGAEAYDYSHLLPEGEHQKGLTLKLFHRAHESNPMSDLHVSIRHGKVPVGFVRGHVSPDEEGNVLTVEEGNIFSHHRSYYAGRGLGTAAYEALMAHAKNVHKCHAVTGDLHSTSAMRVHAGLAEKHGLDYKPKRSNSGEPRPGPFDDRYSPYQYELKSEDEMDKSVLDPNAGYQFSHEHFPSMDFNGDGNITPVTSVYAHPPGETDLENPRLDTVGHAVFRHGPAGDLVPEEVAVDEAHRRRGIASAMYAHAEKVTGLKVVPSKRQSDAGAALWEGNYNNPQFGKAEEDPWKYLRGPEVRKRVGSAVPHERGEDPRHVGGCLTWATIAKQHLGPEASIFTVTKPTLAGGREEAGHAVVSHGGQFHDSRGSYKTPEDVISSLGLGWSTKTGHALEPRDAFLQKHPEGNGLVLHHEVLLGKAEREPPVELEHYSPMRGLKTIDPTFQGTGAFGIHGGEAQRTSRIPRSYYYLAGTQPESTFKSGHMQRYAAKLPPKARLYDIGKDPDNLLAPKVRHTDYGIMHEPVDLDEVEKKIRKRGYHGYKNYHPSIPNAVAVFYPLRARPMALESNTHQIDQGLGKTDVEVLMQHPSRAERQMALKLQGVTQTDVRRGVEDPDAQVALSALKHPLVDVDVLTQALAHSAPNVRIAALQHPGVDAGHIEQALADLNPLVLEALARHPKLEPDHIRQLLERGHPQVLSALAHRPDLTPEHAVSILVHPQAGDDVKAHVQPQWDPHIPGRPSGRSWGRSSAMACSATLRNG